MNEALQKLEVKVENEGATPQGRLSSAEWNVVVSALKAIDAGDGGVGKDAILKAVREAGYVTRSDVNTIFSEDAVRVSVAQNISAQHNFTNGVKINNLAISQSQGDTIFIDANVVVRGGITTRGTNTTQSPSLFDALPIDGRTIKRDANGMLYVDADALNISGGGGGSAEVTYDSVISALGYTPLSTSGGTVTATGRRQLSLQSSTDAQAALWLGTGIEQFTKGGFLQYDYSNGSIALVNFSAMSNSYTGLAGLFIKRDNRITVGNANLSVEYDVLHSGNYANYALPVTGGTVKGNSRFVMMRNGDHSSIVPEVTALTISTNSASYSGYNTGIGFNALGDYGSLTYRNHIHAWIGLGGATTTAEAECYPLVFATNGSTSTGASPVERMRINPDGQVIVTGDTLLGSINLQYSDEINRYGGNLYLQHRNGDGTGHVVMCYNGGNVGFGVAYPSEKAHIKGNLLVEGGFTIRYTSDRRLKQNIRKFSASEMLMRLGGVYQFEYIDSEVEKNHIYGGSHIGLIYQNVVGTALDRMCYEREDGYGSLNYLDSSFLSLIAGVCQELIEENQRLKERVGTLEQRM